MRSGLFVIIALTLVISAASAAIHAAPGGVAPSLTQTTYSLGNSPLNGSSNSSNTNLTITIYFFYGNGCPHCANVEPLLESLSVKYPQTSFVWLEVYYNSTNQGLFQQYNSYYGVNSPVVPEVFIADKALVGDDAIKNNLESEIQRIIESNNNNDTTDTSSANTTTPVILPNENSTESGGTNPATNLTVAMVIVASVADSLNPCALSVMIFLLIFLGGLGDNRKVLKVGAVYIVTVYLVYFITGLGAMTFMQSSAMTRYIYYLAAALSIGIGLINIKDYFFFKKGPTLGIPESRKPVIKRYIERASIPAAITLGFVVSLYELPCTGGIYLAILTLLGNNMTMAEGIPYLALYNVIFVVPLIVILIIFYKGISAGKMNTWRLENRRSLRLVIGVVMVLLGAVMLLGVI